MKFLDPKADLTFKKVFGEHPDLVMSLLNALLPFNTPEEEITSVEYLPAELVPENPLRKNSIVDVRCRDARGRQFIVEMQMIWSPEFEQRVLFNAAKAYVRQLDGGEDYRLLEPVYSLNLVNEVYESEMPDYYHYYRLVHDAHTEKVINGLHLVFVELPKFTPHTYSEKKMQVLWLRYLTEINEETREVPAELLANPDIRKAVSQIEESAFTKAQLYSYEKFWDIISVEKTLFNSGKREGREEGEVIGLEKGRMEGEVIGLEKGREEGEAIGLKKGEAIGWEKGRAEGEAFGLMKTALRMKEEGCSTSFISQMTGLTEEQIQQL